MRKDFTEMRKHFESVFSADIFKGWSYHYVEDNSRNEHGLYHVTMYISKDKTKYSIEIYYIFRSMMLDQDGVKTPIPIATTLITISDTSRPVFFNTSPKSLEKSYPYIERIFSDYVGNKDKANHYHHFLLSF